VVLEQLDALTCHKQACADT